MNPTHTLFLSFFRCHWWKWYLCLVLFFYSRFVSFEHDVNVLWLLTFRRLSCFDSVFFRMDCLSVYWKQAKRTVHNTHTIDFNLSRCVKSVMCKREMMCFVIRLFCCCFFVFAVAWAVRLESFFIKLCTVQYFALSPSFDFETKPGVRSVERRYKKVMLLARQPYSEHTACVRVYSWESLDKSFARLFNAIACSSVHIAVITVARHRRLFSNPYILPFMQFNLQSAMHARLVCFFSALDIFKIKIYHL